MLITVADVVVVVVISVVSYAIFVIVVGVLDTTVIVDVVVFSIITVVALILLLRPFDVVILYTCYYRWCRSLPGRCCYMRYSCRCCCLWHC